MKLKYLIEDVLYGSRYKFRAKEFKDEDSNYLLRNPSRKEIEDLVKDIKKDIRNRFPKNNMQDSIGLRAIGIISPKRIYVWDAYKSTHNDIVNKLKILSPFIEIEVKKEKDRWLERDEPTFRGRTYNNEEIDIYNKNIDMLNNFYSLLGIVGKNRKHMKKRENFNSK